MNDQATSQTLDSNTSSEKPEPKGIVLIPLGKGATVHAATATFDLPEGWDAMPRADRIALMRDFRTLALATVLKSRGHVPAHAMTQAEEATARLSDAAMQVWCDSQTMHINLPRLPD